MGPLPRGSGWLWRAGLSARVGTYELGCPLLGVRRVSSIGLASCPPFRDRTGRRARLYAARHCMFCGGGLMCREPMPQIVADVSPWRGGQVSIGALELRSLGARQQPARQGRCSTTRPGPSQRKRRHHEHGACGTEEHQRRDPPPFEAEQRNHPRRHHLPDRIVFRGGRDARFRGGYLGPVGRAGGAVTPAIPASTNTRGKREGVKCFMTRISPLTSRNGKK